MGNLDEAIKYATKYNWAVFPVSQKTKKPLTPHGCKDAKKNVGAITSWWTRNPDASIGIATGSISNLVVIDADIDENKGIDGIISLHRWETAHHKTLPETVQVKTGRGGMHLYFQYHGSDIGNRAGLLDGLDVRGEGGYIIAPPSMHPNGTRYHWEQSPEEIELAPLDDVVMELLGTSIKKESERFELPQLIPMGERNHTLFQLACSLQSQGLSDQSIRAALVETNKTSCAVPVDDDEIETILSSALKYAKGEIKVLSSAQEWREPKIAMKIDKDGNATDVPAQTISNASEAIEYDKALFGRIRHNEVTSSIYVYGNLPWRTHKGWREWGNTDDSNLRCYLEDNYGLKNDKKIMDALRIVTEKNPVNPIKDMLNECKEQWDGNKYVENLLPTMLGVEKTEYSIQVMRIFMLGAVKRIFYPGCKFDYMLVLVGEQGGYKSSFLRFLAINDEWMHDNFNSLEGDKAFEKLRGMWIVELAELQATKRSKDVESIKSFITSRVDNYRKPYDRLSEQHKRMCVLAGTSNPVDFLTDRTGNRRFLPVTCHKNKRTFDMFADENHTKFMFMQAWGEIMNEFAQTMEKTKLVLPDHLEKEAIDQQEAYLEDNPDIGIIQEWLDKSCPHDRVCVSMIWKEALKRDYEKPSRRDINEIHEIMKNNIRGWCAVGKQEVPGYGIQRCYERKREPLYGGDWEKV